ncbi:hypothetical protein CK203_096769 [Vitis vinifera]|uniref:Uncharacterized protein n=1 Tax=Vitis vinifera TaxID=29760 RepID=A0A438D0W4_VITVI|nr:hypothetical protein CK203_096769 [Vitis vinifera]
MENQIEKEGEYGYGSKQRVMITEMYLGQPKEWAVVGDGMASCSYKELGVRFEKARCAVGEAGYSWLMAYGR